MVPSIFNDVVGPVMRGPSSSHCAAALRIGRLVRDAMEGRIEAVTVQFDRSGSLATTHESQGSDMGLFGGLLGWDVDDERLPQAADAIRKAGVRVRIELVDRGDPHPNTYHLTVRGGNEQLTVRAVSLGGGSVELIELDGFSLSIAGDYWETLVWADGRGRELADRLAAEVDADECLLHEAGGRQLVEIKAQRFVDDAALDRWRGRLPIRRVRRLRPVLPVPSRKGLAVPFATCEDMLRYDAGRRSPLWRLAVEYEAARGGLDEADVLERMEKIVRLVRRSVQRGLAGVDYPDRILGPQCGRFQETWRRGGLLPGGALNRAVAYVTALMEVKSAMGVIVAAPTAGACAALPGVCLAAVDEMGLTDEAAAKALLAGGLIGVFIARRATFAAEVGGCQAECGAACAMAAAALATLAGGLAAQAAAAASMALQSVLGMICDPVANRVEVPCLGKNVLAAANALACANMALAGYDPVIPLDETIEAADRVGRSLPRELRCTALGGLSVTKTSKEIERRLAARRPG